MKKIFIILFLVVIACHGDDDNPVAQIDLLPPATQTGENTFGCLLDGEAFLPGNTQNPLDCVYQFVGGEYYFSLQCNRRIDSYLVRLGCGTEKLQIYESQTYNLEQKSEGNAYGKYFFETSLNYTTQMETGEMTITKLDLENNVVSGTFWYDIKDQDGVVHKIREGRFDMQF